MENLTNFQCICSLLAVVFFCVAFVLVIYIAAKFTYKVDKEKNYQIQRIADSFLHMRRSLENIDSELLRILTQQDDFFDISVAQFERVVDAIEETCDGVTK